MCIKPVMRSWCMQGLFLPGLLASSNRQRPTWPWVSPTHPTVSETLGGFPGDTCSAALRGPVHEAWTERLNSPGLSEVIWCNAITKVKKTKTLHGYAITCPLLHLLSLPPLTDVRVGIWMLRNEKTIQHEVTCKALDAGHSTCGFVSVTHPNGIRIIVSAGAVPPAEMWWLLSYKRQIKKQQRFRSISIVQRENI